MRTAGATATTLQPSVYKVLEGIAGGTVTLVYARWQVYRNSDHGRGNDPLLELAYWIGEAPGVVPCKAGLT